LEQSDVKSFENPWSRSRVVLFALVAVVSAVLVWRSGFFGRADGQATRKDDVASITSSQVAANAADSSVDLSEKQAATLKIGPIAKHEFAIQKNAVGTIDFNENMLVQVFSQYPGKIIKAFYNIGDDVKRGDILFTIDSPDLLQAESTLLASAGVLELQKKTLARVTNLSKQGGMAQREVDQATSDQQTAEGAFKAAKDSVRIFGKSDTEIDQIVINRKVESTLVVPSPIAGRIVTRNAAPGFLTQPGSSPPPFQIADVSTMWMIANVVETDAPAYKLGQEVEVRVPAYPDKVFKGHVTNLSPMIDPNSRRQVVRSEIEDPEHLLRSGMYASFVIRVGHPVTSPAIPADGVVREGDGTNSVWSTTDRRHFVKRTVNIGIRQDDWVQILDGIQPGEVVVNEGAVFLSNKLLLGDAG
jgi:cobalt-zinc-cadmium efflux system membrane fusion protein